MDDQVEEIRDLLCVSRLSYSAIDDEDFSQQDVPHVTLAKHPFHRSSSYPFQQPTPPPGASGTVKSNSAKVRSGRVLSPLSDITKKKEDIRPNSGPVRPLHTINSKATSKTPQTIAKQQAVLPSIQPLIKTEDLESIITRVDSNILENWLKESNKLVMRLHEWWQTGDNMTQFSHFWISVFPSQQKLDLLKMELEIIRDHLIILLGGQQSQLEESTLEQLIYAIIPEFPTRFAVNRQLFFLDVVYTLSSGRHKAYKKLLSAVKCKTSNRTCAQIVLAIRSHALLNMTSAIIEFYHKLQQENSRFQHDKVSNITEIICQAIQLQYLDVIQYILDDQVLSITSLLPEDYNRLFFTGVMANSSSILTYLIQKHPGKIDINHHGESGNTPLHAAIGRGDTLMVKWLLKIGAKVNVINEQCNNATPLHLAVMNGDDAMVRSLVAAGADVYAKMGDLTPLDIAKDFEMDNLIELLNAIHLE
ncbi:uncharacterized protein TRIADDRAFT_52847 [Trichoplax adhaerens]|uniref:SIPAR domain-containing protein n=1 Tax=Trichoplax adhaerens TaxID=10228 RepID=B3RMI0_TRIAD|nr:hypothetical protein TRIADDRAFT_52847 [Trichoplax adhaerens]EDV27870.1 hypothetical protein TRIADDRAFT_52847 [Trichoplax adhaerens]|eukprot:XP_002109704.1 hypothetical protein TRIADDRAFT_52847 [Trichoplax adhaerens]